MSPPEMRDLLVRRLELVQRLSHATAALQRLQQTRASAEMDVQRCESGLEREPGDESAQDLARDLLDARERMAESDRGRERCEAEIIGLESRLAETDHEIEAAASRPPASS